MDQNELPPLDGDILTLLGATKEIPALDASTKASLLAKVKTRLELPPDGGDGGADGGDGDSPGTSSLAGGAGPIASTGVRAMVGLALAAGVVIGVAIDRAVLGAAPVPSSVSTAAPAPPPSAVAAPAESESVPAALLPSAPAATASAPRANRATSEAAPAISARGLSAERALLDVARSALARGAPGEAYVAVDRHELDYPDGALVEEREAIAIKALVALGRRDEARRRAAGFERRFPNGLMLHAVKTAVGADDGEPATDVEK